MALFFYNPHREMAEEKALTFIESSPQEDATAYGANYGAHREGMTKEEVAEYYSKWAASGKYEEVINLLIFHIVIIPDILLFCL